METRTVTVRRLARELNLDRRKVRNYCNYRKLGQRPEVYGRGHSIILTEAEAETVRVELGKRLVLPTIEEIAAELGQRIYSTVDAARELSLCHDTILSYGHDLGVLIQIRNGLFPTYVISAEGLTRIWEARTETIERVRRMLQEQSHEASQIGSRQSQHGALMREEKDYFGKVTAFEIVPVAVQDPELSSETGPQTKTLQWRPFYPSTEPNKDLDLSVWYVSDHRQHLSLDSMIEDGDQI